MRKDKLDNMKMIAEIEQQAMKIFKALVDIRFYIDRHHLIILLLSLYKDDELSKLSPFFKESSEFAHLFKVSKSSRDLSNLDYEYIIDTFRYTFWSISLPVFDEVMTLLFQIDKIALKENFKDIFVLYLNAINAPKESVELTRFISSLINSSRGSKVFNPFASRASLATYLDDRIDYVGYEDVRGRFRKEWALGVLRLKAYNKLDTSKYFLQSPISNWPNESKRFDFIVANIPYGRRIVEPYPSTIEEIVFDKGIKSLNEKGKIIALIADSILFRELEDYRIRKDLIDKDLIDTIILLPRKASYTGKVLLILNKSKEMPGKVRFINAQKLFDSKDKINVILDDERLLNIFQKGYQDSEFVRSIDNSQIIDSDYSLNVSRYFLQDVEGVRLGEFLENINNNNNFTPYSGKLIQIGHLMNDKFDYKLDLSNIEDRELDTQKVQEVRETCILLAKKGRKIRPTLFEYAYSSIYLDSDEIYSFKINDKVVDSFYLINELHAEYVKEQLDAYTQGLLSPFIREEDLLNVIIKLPSIAEQKAKVEGVLEQIEETKKVQMEKDNLILNASKQEYESFASLSHTLGKSLSNINNSLVIIENVLAGENAEWEKLSFNDKSLRVRFDSIYNSVNNIQDVLDSRNELIDFSKCPLNDMGFVEFVTNYVESLKFDDGYTVNLLLELKGYSEILIKGNETLLKIAFDNIVENAKRHAFIDKNKHENFKIEFRVSVTSNLGLNYIEETNGNFDKFIKVEVSNNGKPFPEGYSFQDFKRRGSKAGVTGNTGQGGPDLNEIVKYHNKGKSTLSLVTDEFYSEFTTTYIFYIPLK